MAYLSIPLDEQETTISFGRTDAHAIVWTNDKTVMTKLDKLCEASPENYECIEVGKSREDGLVMDKRYRIKDKSLLSFRSKKIKREMTDEQRAEIAERFKRARFSE